MFCYTRISLSEKPHSLHSVVIPQPRVVVSHSACDFVVLQISAMGDPEGNAKGGFLILDQDLKVPNRTSSSTQLLLTHLHTPGSLCLCYLSSYVQGCVQAVCCSLLVSLLHFKICMVLQNHTT